jgi:serine/threonine-protein kinase RsbW
MAGHCRGLRVDATTSGFDEATVAFRVFTDDVGLDHDALWDLRVALSEWLANIAMHAYKGRDGGVVDLEYRYADGEVVVSVTDDGPAFDPLSLPPPDTSEAIDQRKIGGLGVHFIRRLMDRVEHRRDDGRNTLVIGKRAWPAGAGTS